MAAVLYRAGVRIFSRSFKYHRPRGLYCCSGDCASCMVTVDGEPAVRSCVREARAGQRVQRSNAWPSADHDALSIIWHLRFLLPVGFYYKMFIRPKWLWPVAERSIRKVAGIGPVDVHQRAEHLERRNYHPDVCVTGGGIAGLTAALAAADRGESVVLVDEGVIGEQVAPGPTRSAIEQLLGRVLGNPRITVLERAPASGVYEGPLVTAANGKQLNLIHPRRIVVATGAVERHGVFPGSDLPGVWLGRGAARMAGVHGIPPGEAAVVVLGTSESLEHLATLRRAGILIRAVLAPAALAARVPSGVPVIVDGDVVEARGGRHLTSVVVKSPAGRQMILCDTLVLSLGLVPRDGLLRQAQHCDVRGVGDVANEVVLPPAPTAGFVCTCEDVGTGELIQAWQEDTDRRSCSSATRRRRWVRVRDSCVTPTCAHSCRRDRRERRGPPRRPLVRRHAGSPSRRSRRASTIMWSTARRCTRDTSQWERRWAGPAPGSARITMATWSRSTWQSVAVSASWMSERLENSGSADRMPRSSSSASTPCTSGRSRTGVLATACSSTKRATFSMNGMVAALGPNAYYVTTTSSGAEGIEAWMRDWAETWRLNVYIANQTAAMGAINVAGPRSRDALARLAGESVNAAAIPYGAAVRVVVAGVPCLALRTGFTGELVPSSHPSSRSVELWDALLAGWSGSRNQTSRSQRAESSSGSRKDILVGQDTDFDTTPAKVGIDWAVRMDKPYFVGKSSLERLRTIRPRASSSDFVSQAMRLRISVRSSGPAIGTSDRLHPPRIRRRCSRESGSDGCRWKMGRCQRLSSP